MRTRLKMTPPHTSHHRVADVNDNDGGEGEDDEDEDEEDDEFDDNDYFTKT